MITCCVCEREWPDTDAHRVRFTEEELTYLSKQGWDGSTFLDYCKPCWRILSDKAIGAQLVKGAFQQQLRAQGLAHAEQYGQALLNRLMALRPKGKA